VRVRLSTLVPGVAPEAALAWWFDFHEGATDHDFLGVGVRRRILARSEAEVEMEDRAPLFRERVRAWREPGAVAFEGSNTVSRFRGAYRFTAEADGTRIALDAEIDLRGALRLGLPVARPLARAILRRDLEGHGEEMARELGQAGSQTR